MTQYVHLKIRTANGPTVVTRQGHRKNEPGESGGIDAYRYGLPGQPPDPEKNGSRAQNRRT